MRILLIGFFAFLCWSAFSTYIYVCKIKGLCYQTEQTLVEEVKPDNSIKPLVAEKMATPEDLVIYFAFDKSDFIADAEASEYFDTSNSFLNNNPEAMLNITGHTDAVGTMDYNQALGLRRAQTMNRYFVSKGIAASRIGIESKGEEQPASDNKSKEGTAKNRRSVITIKQ